MPCRSKEFPKRLGGNQVRSTCRSGIPLIWNGIECHLAKQIFPTTRTRLNGSFTLSFQERELFVARMEPPKLDLVTCSFSARMNRIRSSTLVGKTSFITL